ncbi:MULTISPECIES: Fe(3+)-hydroxamate ABC transporter permease FhuB [unclassified Mesorhizobium]|uniref:Fe(3+)-hydroxamate ABC transporter permease FhuB n=1 Tax=unclassified Mesorhizobium TaxID=325217 RepID=UPI00112A1B80|nr:MULTISPECIES: Fe(3+)-hydroxamate ABC transporter permease FhuB [unclassified Mesorhizobium]TPK97368.1 Fe(3+)-hydroxamate ABC transporter permease FhuB [Mesorhizobium sp. B2-4-16]TPL63514.1 Fe(3+)-hydroxamate ABC transporter permease FhuB [Mesorhizobium sp. B2-4-3]
MLHDGRRIAIFIAGGLYLALVAWLIATNIARIGGSPEVRALLLGYAYWPRFAVALLAGAALGLAGVLMQQVLQNPLAAPETLGVNAGAHLALTIGLLAAPALHAAHPELLAISGAFAAWGLIAAIGWGTRDPTTLILTGFVVSFALGSISSLLMLLNQQYLASMFIWGAGSLVEDGWSGVEQLALRVAAGAIVAAALARPLLILGFGDQQAKSLGLTRLLKPLFLATAVLLSASVAAAVGIIGFVGLAAPHLARVLGAEKLGERLVAAPLCGAGLVLLVDQLIQLLPPERAANLPTGAVTALIGAPMLILLLRRVPRLMLEAGGGIATRLGVGGARRPMTVLAGLGIALVLMLALALLAGRAPQGFGLYPEAFVWRLPRVVAACGAGLGLGVAGCLVQRLFANPMASPEILGIGGGVAMGLIATLLFFAEASAGLQLFGATIGALAVTGAILLLGLDKGFTPERLLLTGIAITALLDASSLLFLALGDPRSGQVLAWLSGSTYWVELDFAVIVLAAGIAGLALSALAIRWLEILPLGAGVATSLGVPLGAARLVVLMLGAVTTAAAALIVGPMSFVGLLAPHLAGLLGLRRAGPQLLGAAMTGAALVVFADWVGRAMFAPTELPAGVLSVLIGSLAAMAAVLGRRAAASA